MSKLSRSSLPTALAACGVVAILSVTIVMTQRDTAAATKIAAMAEAESIAAGRAVMLSIADNSAAALIGADPDPAAFDREGLEWWWRNYQRSHPEMAAP